MEIRLLGTVEVRDGDEVVHLGPRQQRLVLGLLAWEANRPVPLDRLIAHVWPDPPRSAAHAIRVAVSGLRSRLKGMDLETHGTGYRLRCDPMVVDVHRFLALVARARDTGAPAYWPWRQVFRQWLADTEPTRAADALGDAIDRIARIVPEIRRLAGAERSAEPTAEERFALFDAVTEFVTRIAVGGLVIVIDDLHWADPASLLLFSHLARGAAGAPLLLVGAFRSYELRQAPRGDDVLAEVTRLAGACRLGLSGLSVDEVAQQLTVELGRPCEPDEAAAVAHRTGGNPLFVREIGRLRQIDLDQVPAGARDAIRQHSSALTRPCRELLATASVLSADIDPVFLAAVSGFSIEDVLDTLDEAVAAAIVRPGLRFAHDLVRDSVVRPAAPARRPRTWLAAATTPRAWAGPHS